MSSDNTHSVSNDYLRKMSQERVYTLEDERKLAELMNGPDGKSGLFSGKGRDPARIDHLLQVLRIAMYQNPDLRLGQLIVNVVGKGDDPFHVEDHTALVRLVNYLNDGSLEKLAEKNQDS